MGDFRMMAVEASLRKMLSQGYFDICTIDKIIKALELVPARRLYEELHLLHCVHYDQMPPAMLEQLPEKIMAVLNSPAMEVSRINLVHQPGTGLRVVSHG